MVEFPSPYNEYKKRKSDETYNSLCRDCKYNKGRIENDIICGNDGVKALLTFDSCIGKKKKT